MNYKKIEESDLLNLKVGDEVYCHTTSSLWTREEIVTAGKNYKIYYVPKNIDDRFGIIYNTGGFLYIDVVLFNKYFSLVTCLNP